MADRNTIGARGESTAAKYLERLGYRIRERNYRCPLGEIDLVAIKDEFIVFIEVKTRSSGAPLAPSQSVTARKRAKVRRLGEYYCAQHTELPLQPRFDVVSVVAGAGPETVEHLINAF